MIGTKRELGGGGGGAAAAAGARPKAKCSMRQSLSPGSAGRRPPRLPFVLKAALYGKGAPGEADPETQRRGNPG